MTRWLVGSSSTLRISVFPYSSMWVGFRSVRHLPSRRLQGVPGAASMPPLRKANFRGTCAHRSHQYSGAPCRQGLT